MEVSEKQDKADNQTQDQIKEGIVETVTESEKVYIFKRAKKNLLLIT